MKGPAEKNFEGIYANPRFMHAAGVIVGCVVQVQVKNGSFYEGVLRTFSSKADFVLEMAHEVDVKKLANSPGSSSSLASILSPDEVTEKLVFRFEDVIMITATNVDPDFATRMDNFTDTGISKFNGQVLERELEPWDGGTLATECLPDLGGSEEEANGWDPNDMFRTNEEKYGVKSSFDSTLQGYTIPLNKQNTEEYKQQEAKASRIAQEIESGFQHKSRIALENGEEEERFSAVVRPDNTNSFRYVSHRARKPQNVRNIRGGSGAMAHHGGRNSHQHPQVFHRVSSPAMAATNSQGSYKTAAMTPASGCMPVVSPRPATAAVMVNPRLPSGQPMPLQPPPPQAQVAPQFQNVPVVTASSVTATPPRATPPSTPTSVPQAEDAQKINGEAEKPEHKYTPKPQRTFNQPPPAVAKESRDMASTPPVANKNIERRKDMDKKAMNQKVRDDKTEDLKRFHAKFKLSEDKEAHDAKENVPKPETPNTITAIATKHHKEKPKDEDKKLDPDSPEATETPKVSNLNPNAKEFVFNPNAKSFTPRGPPVQTMIPPPVQPSARIQTQSPIMAVPQPHLMPGMPPTVFNVAPHYVVSASPMTVPVASPFAPAASVAQQPRYRKAMPMTLERHNLAQPVHVQAATGPPILAQPTLSAPQFTIQYGPSPGMLHPPGPPQQLAYAQMYSLMPRVLAPQPVGMVQTPGTYGDNPQIPTHVYMHPGTPGLQHAMASAGAGQHSAPSTPQSQTPNLHPAPSPVHQQPPPPPQGQAAGQPPTPTGTAPPPPAPQPVVYHHGHPPLHHTAAGHTTAAGQFPGAAYAAAGPPPQPIVLLQQQPPPPTFAAATSLQGHHHHHHHHHLHHAAGQGAGHVGTPTHVLPHAMAMIPTSAAAMVHSQTAAISSGHYVPHSQV